MEKPAVVYLSRYGNPPRLAQDFLASLKRHPAGADFDLILLLKGYPASETDPVLGQARDALTVPLTELRMPDLGLSIDAFLYAAENLTSHRQLLFLTSYSQVLADRWLAAYLAAFETAPDCGAVGATGSYEAIDGAAFPNPHLRTNAFMMDRRLLLGLGLPPPVTKSGNAAFEAGPESLTVQLRRQGLSPLVVDRHGARWPMAHWRESCTFRAGRQKNLLVSDNRTEDYMVVTRKRRRKQERLAWGDSETAPFLGLTWGVWTPAATNARKRRASA